jgi:SAM-dependent methyltransferase
MHDTALIAVTQFVKAYCKQNTKVLDIGGLDVNGSPKNAFFNKKIEYICVDLESHPSVDIVIKPFERLPFKNGEFDYVVSTSCFEHDPCFWMTFKEMCRVTKIGGYIYVNAPSNGPYHKYPGDNWRFNRDAAQALSYWSTFTIENEGPFFAEVEETFFIQPHKDIWIDFVCVWKRVTQTTNSIVVSNDIRDRIGPLEKAVLSTNLTVTKQH